MTQRKSEQNIGIGSSQKIKNKWSTETHEKKMLKHSHIQECSNSSKEIFHCN